MLTPRLAEDRGRANFGWLDSRHTFSFGNYFDRNHMGFGPLRVINDDRVVAGAGFDTHGHQDMEIISYVLEGELRHEDSMGNGSVIRPGEVQRMSAGTGVMHSEFNNSDSEQVHFLQIWILPAKKGLEPGYEQIGFSPGERRDRLRLIGSQDGRDGSVTIHQDVALYSALLTTDQSVSHEFAPGRKGWLHVATGTVLINEEQQARAGDGLAIEGPETVKVSGTSDAEILLFEMSD